MLGRGMTLMGPGAAIPRNREEPGISPGVRSIVNRGNRRHITIHSFK